MRVVRFGVFETASSSVHSVTIGSKDRSRWVKEHRRLFHVPGEIRIEGGEFGWGPETHDDAYTKASYAWTYLLETDQSSGPLRDMLERVLLQGPGVEVVNLVEPERDRYGMGCYIDHQSLEDGPDCPGARVFEDEDTLAAFVWGNSELEIDNDNH